MGLGRGALLLWLGVPIPVIILLALFWHHLNKEGCGVIATALWRWLFSLWRGRRGENRVLANTRSILAAAAAE